MLWVKHPLEQWQIWHMNGVAWFGNHLSNEVAKNIWLQELNLRRNDPLLLWQILVCEGCAKRRVWSVLAQGVQGLRELCGSIQGLYSPGRWSLSQSSNGMLSWATMLDSKRDLHLRMRAGLFAFAWDWSQIG